MNGVFVLFVLLFIAAAVIGQVSKANKTKGGPPARGAGRMASGAKHARTAKTTTKTAGKASAKPARAVVRSAPVTLVAPGDNWALPWLLVLGLVVATAAAFVFS
ncbi:MAG: hypothetical protein PVI23_05915 [Maricaulaceae bacterium]|jgi:hypothetical protein